MGTADRGRPTEPRVAEGSRIWFGVKESNMTTKARFAGLGIALGAALGAVAGVITGNMGVWLAAGVAIGVAVGMGLRRKTEDCAECGPIHRADETK